MLIPNPTTQPQQGDERPPTNDLQRVLLELQVITRFLETLMARSIRTETRLVVLMREHGLNADGTPLDH